MIYKVLQVHISIEAMNSSRTSRLRQALAGAIGADTPPCSPSFSAARGTEGSINPTSSTQTAKVAAAIRNITVNP